MTDPFLFEHSGWYCRVTSTGAPWGLYIGQEEPELAGHTHHYDPHTDGILGALPEDMPEATRMALRRWLKGFRTSQRHGL